MPTDYGDLQRALKEERSKMLEEMNKQYPVELKFNVKGEFFVPAGQTVKVDNLGIEFLPGSDGVDFRITVSRSGSTLESIEADFERLERILDAMSFARFGKKIRASPALLSGGMSISLPIDRTVVERTRIVLERLENISSSMRPTLERSLTWYRDSFEAASVFNHFAMLWNSLEIVLVKIGDDDKPAREKRLKDALTFIASRGAALNLEDLENLNSDILQQSIRRKMIRGFESLFGEDSKQPISICFEQDPPETQLWGIRNDIIHANIVERDPKQRARVTSGGFDLLAVASNSISKTLGLPLQRLVWSS